MAILDSTLIKRTLSQLDGGSFAIAPVESFVPVSTSPYASATSLQSASPLPAPTPTGGEAQVTTGEPGLLDYLKKIGENLLGTARATIESTVRSGVEGGVATSSGAQAGARIGSSTQSFSTTTLLVAALVLILLLRR